MLKNKPDKKIVATEPSFENILVCNNKRFGPFIEILVQYPENIDQQSLGTLIGIFEISDTSEDSSYIVNYLISTIKKEYFSHPRRGAIESFETALHKANLALSKLAENKNINWIGKLNVVCAVFEKNKLHLAKTGAASTFLLRSKTLTDISDNLSEQEAEPNPLKTFDNVSSGKLEVGDKLIITTDNIFDIFSFEEIKKSALRFSDAELVQFLKTALGNELEKAAALIVDIKEKVPEPEIVPARRTTSIINAFSQATFIKPPQAKEVPDKIEKEIQAELDKSKDEFVNKKTGHIYIKETDHPQIKSKLLGDLSFYLDSLFDALGSKLRKTSKKIYAVLKKSFQSLWTKTGSLKIAFPKEFLGRWTLSVRDPLITFFKKIKRLEKNQENIKIGEAHPESENRKPKIEFSFLPSFSRLKDSLTSLSYEQKLYALLAVLAIIFVPYFGLRISKKIAEKNVPIVQEIPPVKIPLELDKNVVRPENLNTAYSGQDVLKPINLNGKLFAVTQTEIAALDSGEKIVIPQDFGQITKAAGMNDLNLIFLINDGGKTISFSSASKKFQDNILTIPEGANIVDAQTYLTYIYLLDAKNNQIYRYPRAEGGFGAKSDWIKESLNLSEATDISINENIFVANGGTVLKLFRGKKQDFNMEQSATPIAPYKVYSLENSTDIYILDKINSRIVKLDASGNIIKQYYNQEIANAGDLAVDETNNTVYFSTSTDVKSFKIE
ncbi:MAG TPA: hypothetical protein VF390_02720 [Patescibacteria group bacterium]